MPKHPKMSASELGALWVTYQKKTMILRLLELFIEKADDPRGKDLMTGLWKKLRLKVVEIEKLFEAEGAIAPKGFTQEDIYLDVPKLFADHFDVMLCRILKEISMGMYVLHLTISYREDIIKLYQELSMLTQTYYYYFTQYLLEKGALLHPNHAPMPTSYDIITSRDYMKGTNFFGHKRPLNAVEYGLLYHSIETNIIGKRLMTGFAQCAKDDAAKKYFKKGQELSDKILKDTLEVLMEYELQPTTLGGTVTLSTEAPFSDKLMMFCSFLLCSFSLGGQGFSTSFNFRNDLDIKTVLFGKDIYTFTRDGVSLMMSKGWLEEPPSMVH